ncbi:MAG TPA: hypothetical protein DEQ30_03545 [Porphyromonadaceae bacterium]|nr:hypothetical protein [Porphyromonadaceae bacterium]
MKKILLHFLLFLPFLIYAQKEKSVRINPNDTATLYLSQFAEEVTPISLNDYNGTPQFVYLTDEYLYIGGISTISQLDLSGKVIKTVNCGYITGITGDPAKKEIYISIINNQEETGRIICYDYALREKKSYKVNYKPNTLFFHKNNLWVYSYYIDNSIVTTYYKISTMDLVTAKETFLPFEIKDDSKFHGVTLVQNGTFSEYNDQVLFSNGIEPVIYGIHEGKTFPVVRYTIDQVENKSSEKHPLSKQGFIGKYLLIEYWLVNTSNSRSSDYFYYLEDMETQKKYNNRDDSFLYDDMYHTGLCYMKLMPNKKGYFYIYREQSDVSKASGRLKLPDAPALFLVKTKQ